MLAWEWMWGRLSMWPAFSRHHNLAEPEVGAGVGWPPVQARAARVIIARNTSATGLIYQLSTVMFEIRAFQSGHSGCGNCPRVAPTTVGNRPEGLEPAGWRLPV